MSFRPRLLSRQRRQPNHSGGTNFLTAAGSPRANPRRRPLRFEPLEDRSLLSVFNVTTAADVVDPSDGLMSLREAVQAANANPGDDTITFAPGLAGKTITLALGELSLTDTTGKTTIVGLGADQLTIDGNQASRIFNIVSGVTADISGLTITDGHVSSSIYGNSGSDGGGILNYGTLTLAESTVSGNSATGVGGGIDNAGTLTVTNSTLSGNSAINGGGIFNDSTLTAVNSTLAGNAAHTGIGGGIYNVTSGMVTVINGTVFDNSGYTIGGGIANYGTLTIGNTIVAGNSANFDDGIHVTPALAVLANIYGEVTANYSLIGDTSGATISGANNVLNQDPRLGWLGNNGGPTQTVPPLPGSPAIDAGSNSLIPSGVVTDQRGPGFPRIVNGTVDIGAVEYVSANMTPLTVTINQAAGQADPTGNSPINFTVVFSEPVIWDVLPAWIFVGSPAPSYFVFSGTAPGTLSATVTGSGTTYNVAVRGMTGSGTVTVSVAARMAYDEAGNPNTASTSTDNTVYYISPPTFALTGPTSGSFTAGATIPIQWSASNFVPGSTINLCLDSDATWNGNETWIKFGLDPASGTYGWDTSAVSPGTYYIGGYLYANGSPTYSHLSGAVTILAAPTPSFVITDPASGTFTVGQTVMFLWAAANVPPGSTVALCYATSNVWGTGHQTWITYNQAAVDGSGVYDWDTTGLTPAHTILAVICLPTTRRLTPSFSSRSPFRRRSARPRSPCSARPRERSPPGKPCGSCGTPTTYRSAPRSSWATTQALRSTT